VNQQELAKNKINFINGEKMSSSIEGNQFS